MGNYIKIQDIHHIYNAESNNPVHALTGIDLNIGQNETVAIIGQNGSGKTTFVKHLNSLLKPSSGLVEVNGINVVKTPVDEMARVVGFAFQNPDDQLFNATVRSEIHFGPKNIGMDGNKAREMEAYAAEITGLSEMLDENPYDLVYSVRKLVAIASVIAMDSAFLILDEPTTGQDYRGMMMMGKMIKSLQAKGKTIITITHDMDFVANNFERTVVLCQGKKLLDGPTYEVLDKTEELKKSRVKPPYLTLLGQKLNFKKPAYSVESFYEYFKEIKLQED